MSKWVDKYGTNHPKAVRLVVEMESETKKLIALQTKIAELERVVGQKQLLIDFQSKMIELAEQEYGIDIKKMPIRSHSLLLETPRRACIQYVL